MNELDSLLKRVNRAEQTNRMGARMIARPFTRRSVERGHQFCNQAAAELRACQTQLGRLRKKAKNQKKYCKVVTLTEMFGHPWQILVRK